ncbi:MAG: hypothetical protein JXJ17_10335 [Anaerolineae bacterium]|nr:hypothetical protein [Anaerolineae bacterium]
MGTTKKRYLLGSGLNAEKLADTIREMILVNTQSWTLTCNAPHNPAGWVYLSAHLEHPAKPDEGKRVSSWVIVAGIGGDSDPREMLSEAASELASGSLLSEWKPGIFFTLEIPGHVSPDDIAILIVSIMTNVQYVDDPNAVDITLEQIR